MSAISIDGLVKTFGATPRPRRAATSRSPRVRCTASSGPTAPASRPRSACCSGCCAPTPAGARCSAATRGGDAVALHRRLAYVPGDVTLWPNLSGGEAIDLLGRLRGGARRGAPRRPARALRARPDQEGPRLLQGQPPEGRAGRRARSDVELLILDEPTSGLDPLMEEVFRACVADERERGRTVLLSQPHPVRGRGAVRPGDHHPLRPHGRDRHAGRAAPPDADHDRGRAPPTASTSSSRSSRVSCKRCWRSSSRAA